MSAFEFITVALSFVLGLGITRILLGAVFVFRTRRTFALHWMPVVWAVSVFLTQIQFWWAIFELSYLIESWTAAHFVTLLLLALVLFVAGALVLPSSHDPEADNLLDYFDQTGRWALLFLSGSSILGLWANWYLFETSPVSILGGLLALMAAIALGCLATRNRLLQGAISVAYLGLAIVTMVEASPAAY